MNPGILTPPTQFATMPRGLLGRPTPVPTIDARRVFDPDAERYIAAVERADGRPLEEAVRVAIGEFVIGCKEDGIWSAIRASCILMGARTLAGALVPLVGSAPTNFNFVSGDYSRQNGLSPDGSGTKYLNVRSNAADPQNDKHMAVHSPTSASGQVIGTPVASGASWFIISTAASGAFCRVNSSGSSLFGNSNSFSGFAGMSRSSPATLSAFFGGISYTAPNTSATPSSDQVALFRGAFGSATPSAAGPINFYSVGSSLSLPVLGSRVRALSSAIRAAIPA